MVNYIMIEPNGDKLFSHYQFHYPTNTTHTYTVLKVLAKQLDKRKKEKLSLSADNMLVDTEYPREAKENLLET